MLGAIRESPGYLRATNVFPYVQDGLSGVMTSELSLDLRHMSKMSVHGAAQEGQSTQKEEYLQRSKYNNLKVIK